MRMINLNKYTSIILCLVVGVFFVSCKDSTISSADQETAVTPVQAKKGVQPAEKVYVSSENTDTWDHIDAQYDSNWQTTVCKVDGSIGLDDPRWENPHKAVSIRPLLSGGTHPFEVWYAENPSFDFDADWINSMYTADSDAMNNDGYGHNWTKYEVPVSGNGSFQVQLLADNCSWVYLDDKLVGYQDEGDAWLKNPANGLYGVTLDGDHTLSFIIYDGGGAPGGKFRLQTTTEDLPTLNTPPVADAGADQTLEATGPTTPVSLDGSASSDEDGDDLDYEWSLNGNIVSNSASASANLAPGSYTYTLTVSDGLDSDMDDVSITVEDTTPPTLSYNTLTTTLWSPNHKMVKVISGISASDIVDGSTDVDITVTSNESSNGRGDGNTEQDYEIRAMADGSYTVYVRAERSGRGNGRTYTISMTSSDDAGNANSASVEVSVADNKGNGKRK